VRTSKRGRQAHSSPHFEVIPEVGTHGMRKTFANRVYRQLHHDLVKTQRAMGHKNINSTVAYLSFVEDEIDAAILASYA
jgi:integrase